MPTGQNAAEIQTPSTLYNTNRQKARGKFASGEHQGLHPGRGCGIIVLPTNRVEACASSAHGTGSCPWDEGLTRGVRFASRCLRTLLCAGDRFSCASAFLKKGVIYPCQKKKNGTLPAALHSSGGRAQEAFETAGFYASAACSLRCAAFCMRSALSFLCSVQRRKLHLPILARRCNSGGAYH